MDLLGLMARLTWDTGFDHVTYVALAAWYDDREGGVPDGGESMRIPDDPDFRNFRADVLDELEMLADAGHLTLRRHGGHTHIEIEWER